jgi:DNA polymerase-3 subunit delta
MPDKPISHFEFLKTFPKAKKLLVYVILGMDSYYSEIVLKAIVGHFQPNGADDYDTVTLYGDSDSVSTALDNLETIPFLAKYKIVIMKDFDQYTAKQIEPLKKYLQNVSPTSVLILMAEKLDARTTFYKELLKQSVVVECKPPYQVNDMIAWLINELSLRNMRMEAEAQFYFANSIDLDYRIAAMEVEKLLLAVDKAPLIRLSDVKNCIGISKKNKIFDLQNAIGAVNLKLSLQIMENLMANEDTNKIGVFTVVMLTRFFTTIWKVHACRSKNLSDQEISNQHLSEIFFSFRKDYLKFANSYNEKALRKIFGLLLQADVDLKSLNVRPEILLEMLIYKIVVIAGGENAVS